MDYRKQNGQIIGVFPNLLESWHYTVPYIILVCTMTEYTVSTLRHSLLIHSFLLFPLLTLFRSRQYYCCLLSISFFVTPGSTFPHYPLYFDLQLCDTDHRTSGISMCQVPVSGASSRYHEGTNHHHCSSGGP